MLKKSNTKFAYFRKVFALPLLFCLVFVYMVKAENGEIKKSNKIISQQISALQNTNFKTDSIAYGVNGTALYEEHPDLFFESEEAYNQHLLNKKNDDTLSPERRKQIKKVLEDIKQGKIDVAKTSEFKTIAEDLLNNYKYNSKKEDTAFVNGKFFTITLPEKSTDALRSSLKIKDGAKYFLNGVEISSEVFKSMNPYDIKSISVLNNKGNGEVYIKTKDAKLSNERSTEDNPWKISVGAHQKNKINNNTGSSYFIPFDSSKEEISKNSKQDNPWIIAVKAIAPPQKVSKTENSGYYSGTSVWIDNGNSKKEISDLTEEELLKLKIYLNAKETDWKTLKEQNPKLIKQLLEKHNNKNYVDKMK